MAKKINRQPQANVNRPLPQRPVTKTAPVSVPGKKGKLSFLQKHLLVAGGILLVTLAFLYPSLANQFTNWDDPGYVINQPIIKDFSSEGIRNIFSKSIMGNYHPLTMLTYAWDYSVGNLQPEHYHWQSLLFHLATTLLVYCFVQLLTGRIVAAGITALLFGIHPMHVESVAWIAGRKDVVYGFFYMAACIAYLYYHRTAGVRKWLWYALVATLFLCSLLAKPVAVILPITLLVIDIFDGRLFAWRPSRIGFSEVLDIPAVKEQQSVWFTLLEKVPLLALSVGFGWRSIQDQHDFGALGTQGENFNFIERIGLGGYALVTYLWKAVVPLKFLCFYPYPQKEGNSLPAIYYIYPLIAALVIFGLGWFFRRNKGVIFGLLFFLTNIALLLQFIPVGGAIIADRYSYIPYLGLFFMLGWAVSYFFEDKTKRQMGILALSVTLIYSFAIGYLSNERCKVWYDAMSLWRDEIEVEPERAPNAYNNLGFQYYNKFNASVNQSERKIFYDSSHYLLTRAIELQADFVNPYISLGELQRSNGEYPAAKINYYTALKKSKDNEMSANAYMGLAITYSILLSQDLPKPRDPAVEARILLNKDSANFCYQMTFKLKSYYPEAHSNYANFLDMTGDKNGAIVEYGKSIQQNPDVYTAYLNRGRALQRMNKCDEAFLDFAKAIAIKPEVGELYYARAFCYLQKGNKAAGLQDVEKAKSLGFTQIDLNFYQQLKN